MLSLALRGVQQPGVEKNRRDGRLHLMLLVRSNQCCIGSLFGGVGHQVRGGLCHRFHKGLPQGKVALLSHDAATDRRIRVS